MTLESTFWDDQIREVSVLNFQLRGGNGRFGLRKAGVFCVARDGRPVTFAEPAIVRPAIRACLFQFQKRLAHAKTHSARAEVAAWFWMTFIAIHPFEDANGRTGEAYLRAEFDRRGWELNSFELVKRYLITGNVDEDLKNLKSLFILTVVPTLEETQFPSEER